jgi:hypothetical protein
MDHTLPKVDLDVVEVVAVVVAVVGVEVELSTRKLRHKRESLLSAMTSLVTSLVWGYGMDPLVCFHGKVTRPTNSADGKRDCSKLQDRHMT